MLSNFGISKRLVHATADTGNFATISYPKDTKFTFHYRIQFEENDGADGGVVLDDSRKYGRTMELYVGNKFQIECWELCLETMAVGEVAAFTVDKAHLGSFPMANKKLRDYMLNKHATAEGPKHCCAMMSLRDQGGLDYPDLDKLLEKPRNLVFTFDLIKVERPDEVRKESWIMNETEKSALIPCLRSEGNEMYKKGDFSKAICKYSEALHLLEQLTLAEKPEEPEWHEINHQKIPYYLNLAQCQIQLKEFYAAITNLGDVLKLDKDNVKALFRRARCFREVFNFSAAERDYDQALQLDPSLSNLVQRELQLLRKSRRQYVEEERNMYQGKLLS